ncbi:endopeptidase, partial [Clostridium botulinum]|nr:endopeptidase [Clostridium botulinum]
ANYKVNMANLKKTMEYKKYGYDVLEKICLGDTVHCYNKNIDIEVSARCISYRWDCINEEYIEIELGEYISNYIDENLNSIDNLYRKIVLEKQYILLKVDSLDNS